MHIEVPLKRDRSTLSGSAVDQCTDQCLYQLRGVAVELLLVDCTSPTVLGRLVACMGRVTDSASLSVYG